MDFEEQFELLSAYADALMMVMSGAALLGTVAMQPGWAGAPTRVLRDDLLRHIEALRGVLGRADDRVCPRLDAEARNLLEATAKMLQRWDPSAGVPRDLGVAATQLAFAMSRSLAAPSPSADKRDGPRIGVDELGLPVPRQDLELLYNASAPALVARVVPETEPGQFPRSRVFVRRPDEPRYREVVLPGERLGAKEIVSCAAAPVAFVHALLVTVRGTGADDGGLFRVSLPDGSVEPLAASRDLDGWVSTLLGASADGASLHMVVAGMTAVSSNRCVAGYRVATLDTVSGEMTDVAPLPGIFA